MWWRRDPSLWSRPIGILPKRILRDTDALLRNTESALHRSRQFSRSQPTTGQQQKHKDGSDNDEQGISGLDYRRWKKEWERRIIEDPFKVLFGASEARLKGVGFGRGWMEMWMEKDGVDERREKNAGEKRQTRETSKNESFSSDVYNGSRTYPRKVDISDEDALISRARGSYKLGSSENSAGVASPSDTRRPQEYNEPLQEDLGYHKVKRGSGNGGIREVGDNTVDIHDLADVYKHVSPEDWAEFEMSEWAARKKKEDAMRRVGAARNGRFSEWQKNRQARREAMEEVEKEHATVRKAAEDEENRGRGFMSKFLNESSSAKMNEIKSSPSVENTSSDKEWKQTVLERRATSAFTARREEPVATALRDLEKQLAANQSNANSKAQDDPHVKEVKRKSASSVVESGDKCKVAGARFWPAMLDHDQLAEDIVSRISTSQSAAQKEQTAQSSEAVYDNTDDNRPTTPAFTRSTSEVLKQLPKDDIDFLSASDIRAAMGAKKNAREETSKSREELEKEFKESYAKMPVLDPVIESKIVNDKHIRRLERELKVQQKAKTITPETPAPESIFESSLQCLTQMIHDGGDVLTRYLWSDPISSSETPAPTKTPRSPMLEDIVHSLRQNRNTMKKIGQDLENDIPATGKLLKGLKDFENRAIGSVVSLSRYRGISDSSAETELRKKHDNATESLKLVKYHSAMTKQVDKACKDIDAMTDMELPEGVQERLRVAQKTLKENASSTRTMWHSLMGSSARLAGLDAMEPLHQILIYHLRAMYHLQNSLLKIIERVMLRFGVSASEHEEVLEAAFDPSDIEISADSKSDTTSSLVEKSSAANLKLEKEIQAQKLAMRGLSDDGYTRVLKPSPSPDHNQSLDESRLLAYSLYRPFSQQQENLGKEEEAVKEPVGKSPGLLPTFFNSDLGSKTLTGSEDTSTVPPFSVERPDTLIIEAQDTARVESVPSETSILPKRELGERDRMDQSTVKSLKDNHVQEAPITTSLYTTSIQAPTPYLSLSAHVPETAREPPPPSPTTCKILTYNASTDELSITTTTAPTHSSKQTISLLEALAALDHPAKFTPHIPAGFDIVITKSDMLVLRESSAGPQLQTAIINYKTGAKTTNSDHTAGSRNPADKMRNTTSIAYANYDITASSPSDNATRGGQDRRPQGEAMPKTWEEWGDADAFEAVLQRRAKTGGKTASVLKTAIVAGAGCYALGVVGELLG